MLNIEKLRLYKSYLNTLQNTLDKYFENQKEYICCKKGCSLCCEKGIYPYSEIEYAYLVLGFFQLDKEKQVEILERIKSLKDEYLKSDKNEKFIHRCPFLDESGSCQVYEYRGIICRTFGLLQMNKDGKITRPFCGDKGLNYSKVFDEDDMLDLEAVKNLGYKHYPQAFEITLGRLTDKRIFTDEILDFGEEKPLIEWL